MQKHLAGRQGRRRRPKKHDGRAFGQHYATPYVQALRRARYPVVLNALRPAVEIYDRLRRDAGWLNFQDLLLAAARLLREDPAIRSYFRKRFTHLLIDEFQDTDPIQAEVMMLLTADDPNEDRLAALPAGEPARSSSSATPSSRSTGFAVPTSSPTTK